MEALKTIWDFFQNEVVGMAWLNRLIGNLIMFRLCRVATLFYCHLEW